MPHTVTIERLQAGTAHRFRAACRDCSFVGPWATTEPGEWVDQPRRPARAAQQCAIRAAEHHIRSAMQTA